MLRHLLASALAAVDVGKVHDLHMVQSGVVLPEHLDVFDGGVAKRLDCSDARRTPSP